ncbi:phage tail sheath subtilisin-like domain-containing protein [Photorhabdus temperata]|uniref:Phage tail sheath protein FI n=1 Tax=Photorhabdus temperata subsp. temperata Meg1 TaxID=1393735 RepID=A0A081S1K5_PHOTE|nr:phage tail sheath C-terminal domain-containing protein [Photorhabdus temperata]KER04808.1 phage tail sheath protein FI [Photorhabdus temperata subsp. temperata Meg1]MCT8346543.1 phage tail sheath subtilisin-like domain-containing protein [Photorhabdus temperata]
MASATYATPGVYIEEDASLSLSINTSPTAIPVFIGKFFKKNGSQLEKGSCIRITSWLDFTSQFSLSPAVSVKATAAGSDPKTYTYSATVTATSYSAFAVQHYFNNGGGVCYVLPLIETEQSAVTAELATLPDLIEKQQEITLLVCPETDIELKQKVYDAVNSLLQAKVGYFLIADSKDGTEKPSTQLDKTAVYYPDLVTSFTYSRPADDKIVLNDYEGSANLAALKTASPKEYAAAKKTVDDKLRATKIILPPSAAVAGAYAATDANRGVWKAPANLALNNAKPSVAITDTTQGTMNDAGINVIRAFTGKGTLIWGARTLDKTDNWRYIPVRRLFNAAERDIKKAMQFAVFEPNSQPTWKRVQTAIDNYLYQLWQQGALAGNKPQEAYFVQIGKDITMSEDEIKQGKMIVKVGMAAVRPAEFIILQFSQNVAQ